MALDNTELQKILNFILNNKKIIISKNTPLNKKTLAKLKTCIKGKIPSDFEFSKEQERLILQAFIEDESVFDENTPQLILNNEKCAISVIKRDINSINYIKNFTDKIKETTMIEVKNKKYILSAKSPDFLKADFGVASASIKLSRDSVYYILWDIINEKEREELINILIEQKYVLNYQSPYILKTNKNVILASIKQDIKSADHIPYEMKIEPKIFKYLLINKYFSRHALGNMKLSALKDDEIIDCFLQGFGIYNYKEIFDDRIKKIVKAIICEKPMIKNFNSVFQMVAELDWIEHKSKEFDMFENIFGKICSQLQSELEFDKSIKKLKFLPKMLEILNDKAEMFINTLKEYYLISHNNEIKDKIAELQPLKNIISKYSALYTSKSKELYKKEQIESYIKMIRPYYVLKKDNPTFKKNNIRLIKREKFRELYIEKDDEILVAINNIVSKYNDQVNSDILNKMIVSFILDEYNDIGDFVSTPSRFEEYKAFEEISKLINRLNNNYITFNSVEVRAYKHLISYSEELNKYYYIGSGFSEEEIKACEEYKKLSYVFKKIKRDIMAIIKNLQVNEEVDGDILDELEDSLSFTDRNYQFNLNYELKKITFGDFLSICKINEYEIGSLEDKNSFEHVYDLLINNNMAWLLLLLPQVQYPDYLGYQATRKFIHHKININNITSIINDMPEIVAIAQELKIGISSIEELMDVHKMNDCFNKSNLAILGREIIKKLYTNTDFIDNYGEEIIRIAEELICGMSKKSHSTVPYVFGNYLDYNYSMYDSLDESILVSGINTDSCFRVGGNCNDFLHYCGLDKNGFIIKITDYFGNFIGRAAGFRNGNTVYINQLRTIYDEQGNEYLSEYDLERADIIKVFKKACEDIVMISQNNQAEKEKIDHVFVTKSYALYRTKSNVSSAVTLYIGEDPMDIYSEDWELFREQTNNLQDDDSGFATDYGEYQLICMASIKDAENLKEADIKSGDVPALYERQRNPVTIQDQVDSITYRKVNKIKAISCYYDETEFEEVIIFEDSIVYYGDNWFIISSNDGIIDECLLDFDKKAEIEFKTAQGTIKANKINTLKLVNKKN